MSPWGGWGARFRYQIFSHSSIPHIRQSFIFPIISTTLPPPCWYHKGEGLYYCVIVFDLPDQIYVVQDLIKPPSFIRLDFSLSQDVRFYEIYGTRG